MRRIKKMTSNKIKNKERERGGGGGIKNGECGPKYRQERTGSLFKERKGSEPAVSSRETEDRSK